MCPGVNFINVKGTNFSYEHCFGSFYYVHVTRKKAAKTTFIRKICSFNIDEIDGRCHFQQLFTCSFYASRSQKRKNTATLSVFLRFWDLCMYVKAAHKLLVKLTPGGVKLTLSICCIISHDFRRCFIKKPSHDFRSLQICKIKLREIMRNDF